MRIGETTPAVIYPVTQPVEMCTPTQPVPRATTMVMPTVTGTAQVMVPDQNKPDLAPQDLLKPLPSIVNNQPIQLAQCNSFSDWIDQNPLLAGGILLGLAWIVLKKK